MFDVNAVHSMAIKAIPYLVANATLFYFFLFFFSQICIETSTFFTFSNLAWGMHCGVDVKWSGGLLVLELHCRDCGKSQQRN